MVKERKECKREMYSCEVVRETEECEKEKVFIQI